MILALLFLPTKVSFAQSDSQNQTKPSGIEVFFTPAPAPTLNFEELPNIKPEQNVSLPANISPYARILELIQNAQEEIIFTAYQYNLNNFNLSLLSALKRSGLKVTVFIEEKESRLPETVHLLGTLKKAGATIYLDLSKSGIMHNKFLVIDKKIVVTGSANFTHNGFFQQYNDVVILHNRDLAMRYREYIYELFGLTKLTQTNTTKKNPSTQPLPPLITDNYNPQIRYQLAFSGRTKYNFFTAVPQTLIARELKNCNTSVHLLTFVFTSAEILKGLKTCLRKNPSVPIQGIFDNIYEKPVSKSPETSKSFQKKTKTVPFDELKKIGAEVRYDIETLNVHHKNFIIDADTVITGSYNFSESAHIRNDENLLIIYDSLTAKKYLKQFETLWQNITSPVADYSAFANTEYINALLKTEKITGTVTSVISGNLIEVRETSFSPYSKTKILVRLAGIIPPISSATETSATSELSSEPFTVNQKTASQKQLNSQEPQASMAKEALIFLSAGRNIQGKILAVDYPSNNTGFDEQPILTALVYLAERSVNAEDGVGEEGGASLTKAILTTSTVSINEYLLRQGVVYPLFKPTSINVSDPNFKDFRNGKVSHPATGGYFEHGLLTTFTKKYVDHNEWKKSVKNLELAFSESYLTRKNLWGKWKLTRSPLSHIDLMNK